MFFLKKLKGGSYLLFLYENEYINFLIEHFFFCHSIFRLNEIIKNNVLKYLIMSFPFTPPPPQITFFFILSSPFVVKQKWKRMKENNK